jgi:phosphomannomutase/phosphoglucomutase
MSKIDPHIFRAYDIRGKAGSQITEDVCLAVGRGFGAIVKEMYKMEHPRIAVGRDARIHGPAFHAATIEGLKQSGCHVVDIGQTPSPVNYFTICNEKLDGSIQITASHNPAEDNGLKLQLRDAEAFAGDDLQKLRERIEGKDFSDGEGKVESFDAVTPYVDHLTKMFKGIGKGKHIVVDHGNGVAGPVYNRILKAIGCELTELYSEPDGTFPNHAADPSKYETLAELQKTVTKEKAALGFAFDGDGDRMGLVDERGTIRSADDMLLLLAEDHLKRRPGAPVVFTVSNSGVLDTEIAKWGGKPVMCKVGHSFVEHTMRENDASLGGEQSGHFFLGEDYFGFDDAMIAALRILKITAESDQPISALFEKFPKVYQSAERRPHCPDGDKTRIVKAVIAHFTKTHPVNTLDGARIDFGDGAWAGIRQSNTSPKLSIVIEARSPKKLEEVEKMVLGHLESYPEIEL